MVLTHNKSGLHFTDPNAKAGDKEDQNEDALGDDIQDKTANDNVGGKDKPSKTDPMIIMVKKFQLIKNRISQQDKFNEIILEKMIRIVDPKDSGTSNPHKDKGKRIMGDTSKKTLTTKQQKKSKIFNQPQQNKKGNHAPGKGDQTHSRGRVVQKDKTDARV
uniref:Uncharacterized protein n=1 Tax=Cannabis sativa TaxID=3483 RepID=A0A803P9V8_CANSA